MTTTNTPQYLIRAESKASAEALAEQHSLEPDSWLRIPFTIDNDEGVFVKTTSEPLDENNAEAAEKNYALENLRDVRLLLAADFWMASKYVAERNWWLHSWSFVSLPPIADVVEYELVEL